MLKYCNEGNAALMRSIKTSRFEIRLWLMDSVLSLGSVGSTVSEVKKLWSRINVCSCVISLRKGTVLQKNIMISVSVRELLYR